MTYLDDSIEIKDLKVLVKERIVILVEYAPTLHLVVDESDLSPLEDVPYLPFIKESMVILDIPEIKKIEVDEDEDLMLLKEVQLRSLEPLCIHLPQWEPIPSPPCSPCTLADSISYQLESVWDRPTME